MGRDNVEISLGYVGLIPSSYPINAIYQWTGGPEEAILRVALKEGARVDIARLRGAAPARELADAAARACGFSFEPADIVNEVMSFGSPRRSRSRSAARTSPTTGPSPRSSASELAEIPSLRDLQYGQSLDYPTVSVESTASGPG